MSDRIYVCHEHQIPLAKDAFDRMEQEVKTLCDEANFYIRKAEQAKRRAEEAVKRSWTEIELCLVEAKFIEKRQGKIHLEREKGVIYMREEVYGALPFGLGGLVR